MSKRYRSGGIIGPLILICLSGVFLLHNVGVVAWSVWDVIFNLWPILLIAIGVDLLIGRRSAWGSVLAAVVILALFAGALVFLEPGWMRGDVKVEQVQMGEIRAGRAAINLEPSIAYLRISAAKSSADHLLEGEIVPQFGEDIFRVSTSTGDSESVRVWSSGAVVFPFFTGWSGDSTWDFRIHPGVETTLRSALDIGSAQVDLESVSASSFSSDLGVGQNWVKVPGEGQADGEVSTGIGGITIIIPEGMEARIRAATGLGYIDVPDDFRQAGDVYFSPGYEGAGNQVELTVDVGIGWIQVE